MSIYDIIANPKGGGSFLQGLQVMDSMRNRKEQRTLLQMKQQDLLANRQAGARKAAAMEQGRGMIRDKLSPMAPPEERPVIEGERPTDLEGQPIEGPQQAQQAMGPMFQSVANVKTSDMEDAETFQELNKLLMSVEGMEDTAKTFYDMAEKTKDRLREEGKVDRKQNDALFEISGLHSKEISELEEAGKPEEAAAKFDQMRELVLNDPRFAENEDIKTFYEKFPDYTQGIGKFLYLSTRVTQEAREAVYGEPKEKETKRHNIAMEGIANQKNTIARMKEGKGSGFKSSDANTLYKFAVGYHGGMFDESGQLKFLDPEKSQDVQDLSELSAILYSRGKYQTHNEAVSAAAKQLDMKETKAGGNEYTKEDLEYTAKQMGLSIEETKKRLKAKGMTLKGE